MSSGSNVISFQRPVIRLDKIPQHLQRFPNWVFYMPKKAPIRLSAVARGWPAEGWNHGLLGDAHSAGAKINVPSTWGLFEDLGRLWQRENKSALVAGPSIALVKELGIVVIDLDDPMRTLKNKQRAPIGGEPARPFTPEETEWMLTAARQAQREVLEIFRGHYIERSASGTGYHIFVGGVMPQGYERCKFSFHGSVFTSGQFINMTGDIGEEAVPGSGGLAAEYGGRDGQLYLGQEAINRFVDKFAGMGKDGAGNVVRVGSAATDEVLLAPVSRDDDYKSDIGDVDNIELLMTDYVRYGRRVDLSDSEVVEKLSRGMQAVWNGGAITGDHSEDTVHLLGDLEKISGSVEQIERVFFGSPRMMNAGIGNDGKDRYQKRKRLFARDLLDVRAANDKKFAEWESKGTLLSPERAEWARLAFQRLMSADDPGSIAGKERRAREEAARKEDGAAKEHSEAVRRVRAKKTADTEKAGIAGLGSIGITGKALDALKVLRCGIDDRWFGPDVLPPGRMGLLCHYAAQGMKAPFYRFAIPATFATIAGICAGKYKLFDGTALNLLFVLMGKTGTGKTQSIESWDAFFEDLRRELPFKNRYSDIHASSRAGMHKPLEKHQCFTWVKDECAPLLSSIIAPRAGDQQAEIMQSFANQIFDLGKAFKEFHPPASIRSQKDEDKVLMNVCVSTFWGTTNSNAKTLFTKDSIHSGIIPRMNIIDHGKAGGIAREYGELPLTALPQGQSGGHCREAVSYLLRAADELDSQYYTAFYSDGKVPEFSGKDDDERRSKLLKWNSELVARKAAALEDIRSRIVHVQVSYDAMQLAKAIFRTSDEFARSIQNEEASSWGQFEEHYLALNRVGVVAMRLAGVIAVIENWMNPIISVDSVSWSLAYVLQNMCSVLSAIDENRLGVTIDKAELTVITVMKLMSVEERYLKMGCVPFGDLARRLTRNDPFVGRGGVTGSAWDAAKKCIENMVEIEMLDYTDYSDVDDKGNLIRKTGPRPRFLRMNDHECWK